MCIRDRGAAQLGDRITELDELIAEADRQLYRAKQQGRDRLCMG